MNGRSSLGCWLRSAIALGSAGTGKGHGTYNVSQKATTATRAEVVVRLNFFSSRDDCQALDAKYTLIYKHDRQRRPHMPWTVPDRSGSKATVLESSHLHLYIGYLARRRLRTSFEIESARVGSDRRLFPTLCATIQLLIIVSLLLHIWLLDTLLTHPL
jgi:hypothetical protein